MHFATEEQAREAVQQMSKVIYGGRIIEVIITIYMSIKFSFDFLMVKITKYNLSQLIYYLIIALTVVFYLIFFILTSVVSIEVLVEIQTCLKRSLYLLGSYYQMLPMKCYLIYSPIMVKFKWLRFRGIQTEAPRVGGK